VVHIIGTVGLAGQRFEAPDAEAHVRHKVENRVLIRDRIGNTAGAPDATREWWAQSLVRVARSLSERGQEAGAKGTRTGIAPKSGGLEVNQPLFSASRPSQMQWSEVVLV
jgi:hypothetical protein